MRVYILAIIGYRMANCRALEELLRAIGLPINTQFSNLLHLDKQVSNSQRVQSLQVQLNRKLEIFMGKLY